ncbi:MAG: hypothetical protein WCJ14_14865 [Verrucomicrobiota bacterium]
MSRIVEEPAPGRPAYFWWLLVNILALCFAVISWALCMHVFGHPEIPRNYDLLRRIGRLPHLKRYTVADTPPGNVLDPKGQYGRFVALSGGALDRVNSQLIRNYLTNFAGPQALSYIEGDYQVEAVREFGRSDLLPSGFAVRARALVKPDDFSKPVGYPVVIEYVFSTTDTAAARDFHPGDVLAVKKPPHCAAIVHVERLTEGGEQVVGLTVMPLAYGSCRMGNSGAFTLEPPTEIRLTTGLPVFKP